MRDSMRGSGGFTLLELMITLVVLAVLAAIAFPNFRYTLQSNHVATRVNMLVGSLAFARSEAVRSSQGAGVCASANGTACGTDWTSGWLVWDDSNGNGVLDSGETVVRYVSPDSGVTAQGPAGGIVAFDSRGRRTDSSAVSFSITPADCRAGDTLLRTVTVNPTGSTTLAKGTCE